MNYLVMLSVDGFLLESSAYNIVYWVDGDEGGFVLFQGNVLQLAHFKAGNDAVEDLFGITGIGTLPVEKGDASP